MNYELFLRGYPEEIREIIDLISGVIIETFPNIRERIVRGKLKYIHPNSGALCEIYSRDSIVFLEFKNKKFEFDKVDLVNRQEIASFLENNFER